VEQLASMGFSRRGAKKALHTTGVDTAGDLSVAVTYLISHADDKEMSGAANDDDEPPCQERECRAGNGPSRARTHAPHSAAFTARAADSSTTGSPNALTPSVSVASPQQYAARLCSQSADAEAAAATPSAFIATEKRRQKTKFQAIDFFEAKPSAQEAANPSTPGTPGMTSKPGPARTAPWAPPSPGNTPPSALKETSSSSAANRGGAVAAQQQSLREIMTSELSLAGPGLQGWWYMFCKRMCFRQPFCDNSLLTSLGAPYLFTLTH
jgi:hypothetical protein